MKIRVAGISLIFLAIFFYEKEIAMAQLQEIRLSEPIKVGKVSVEEAIQKRRSQRNFVSQDLDWPEISQLLWATQGITAKKGSLAFRSAPSAGALYPMEIYLLSKDGLFHYLPNGHSLEVVGQDDLRGQLAQASLDQASVAQAPVNIVICAVYQRVTGKYGRRGIRFVHIEAGHVAQNIHLQAVAMGLGSVPIGAFVDEEVKEVLSLPDDQEPIYIIPVGYTK